MAYRRTERVEARLADNRARILRAARQLVAEGGFREAQIAAVAALAEVAVGTVYRYFPAKADLFAEIVRTVSQREVDVLREIADSGGPASERLAAAVRAFASRAIRGRRLAWAVLAEPVDPEVDDVRLEYRRNHYGAFERIIREGVKAGEFPPQDVEASAACLVGAFMEGLVGPLAMESVGPGGEGSSLVEALVGFSLRAVGARTRAVDAKRPRARSTREREEQRHESSDRD
jgi:AcrR family transcriptional regulator